MSYQNFLTSINDYTGINNFNKLNNNSNKLNNNSSDINYNIYHLHDTNYINKEDKYVKLSTIDESSKNNGLLTKVWGPPLWIGLHSITFGYPYKIDLNNPDHKNKKKIYYNFFKLLGYVLPCKYCRNSYQEYFDELDPYPFLDKREDIVRWFYLIHDKVNDKLNVPSCDRISFYNFTKLYESYRAKCKPDKKEEDIVKKVNEEKGCIKPLDNTPKRSIINIIKCDKGDVTRRKNAFDNWTDSKSSNYFLIHKKWILLTIILFIITLLLFLYFI